MLFCLTCYLTRSKSCDCNMAEYIAESKPLGGLIFLLPRMFSFENKDGMGSNNQDESKEPLRNVLAELEQILIHANLPVSIFPFCGLFSFFFLLEFPIK